MGQGAAQVREKLPDAVCYQFYIDMRAFGKGYEEFYEWSRRDRAEFWWFTAERLGIDADAIRGWDLMAHDLTPASLLGADRAFLAAPRIDNLASCHAAVTALCGAAEGPLAPLTRVVVLYDHEEVGSRSAQGAAGNLLADCLERTVSGFKGGAPQGLARAISLSRAEISCTSMIPS